MAERLTLPPENAQRLSGLMGLCVRARQATFGEGGCLKAIRSGGCALLLVDGEISPAMLDKYSGACAAATVPLAVLPADLLYSATGRPGKAMAVLRGTLAPQLLALLRET